MALELSRTLGGLPLALDQAGAYIRAHCTFADYLSLYQTRRWELLSRRWDKTNPRSDHPESIVTTLPWPSARWRRKTQPLPMRSVCVPCLPPTNPGRTLSTLATSLVKGDARSTRSSTSQIRERARDKELEDYLLSGPGSRQDEVRKSSESWPDMLKREFFTPEPPDRHRTRTHQG